MEIRSLPNEQSYRHLTTKELRGAYVLENLFVEDAVSTAYLDADRAIVGGAMPVSKSLVLEASKKEMAAEYFNERRETGIVNVGGDGIVKVDGQEFQMQTRDMLYVGRGAKRVEFAGGKNPVFYFVSFPAHTSYPTVHIPEKNADKTTLGSLETSNKRTLRKYVFNGGARSCQLVMGLTELETGSVWNTMPAHTHVRRMEVYLYYNLPDDGMVVHLMGPASETRNLLMRNRQAVVSPAWSIHCGAGTAKYSFVWAMGGENQEFADMDAVAIKDML